jgi:hypothetical protein
MMIILLLIDYDEINSGDEFEVNTGRKAEHDNAMFGKRAANLTIKGLVGGEHSISDTGISSKCCSIT